MVEAMGKVDPDDLRQPYRQVADGLRDDIASGVFPAGQRLPRQSELAGEYGVSVGTVKSGLAVLRDEGLIVSRQGEGSWVRMDAQARDETVGNHDQAASDSAEIRTLLKEVLDRLTGIEHLLTRESDRS